MFEVSPRTAGRAAFAAAGLNLAASVIMLVLLQPGLPVDGISVQRRLAYVAGNPGAWLGGWLVWHAAAFALLGFYLALAVRWSNRAPIRCGLAVLGATAGLSADLAAEAIYMGVAPRLGPDGFLVAEAIAGVLTGYLGNGLYTVAGALLIWAGAEELPPYLIGLSIPVWIAGFVLSAASLTQSATGQFWSTAVLMPSFVLWTALMGRWLCARAS